MSNSTIDAILKNNFFDWEDFRLSYFLCSFIFVGILYFYFIEDKVISTIILMLLFIQIGFVLLIIITKRLQLKELFKSIKWYGFLYNCLLAPLILMGVYFCIDESVSSLNPMNHFTMKYTILETNLNEVIKAKEAKKENIQIKVSLSSTNELFVLDYNELDIIYPVIKIDKNDSSISEEDYRSMIEPYFEHNRVYQYKVNIDKTKFIWRLNVLYYQDKYNIVVPSLEE